MKRKLTIFKPTDMNIKNINKAKEELKRLELAIIKLEKKLDKDKWLECSDGYIRGCKESGYVKRASMDLSNALIEIRK